MKRALAKTPVYDAKDIVQPSSVASISLWYRRKTGHYVVEWRNDGRRFTPENLGVENRFKTSEAAIEFAHRFGFGAYRIDGKKVRRR
jgi:hypothetical protein